MKTSSLLLLFILLFFSSCSLKEYNQKTDLDVTSGNKAYISGKIIKNEKSSKPYYLVLYKVTKNEEGKEIEELVEFSTHIKEEKFKFTVTEGTYFIYACQNPEKITEQRLAYEFLSDYIVLDKKSNHNKIDIKMHHELTITEEDNILIETTSQNSITKEISYNQVRNLNDIIFNRKNASIGLWGPMEFLAKVGGGIYMLDEFDKNKTPVLFIHGMKGTPTDFETIIENIDRTKFQPWVYYYPSGLNLNYSVDILKSLMDYISLEYEVEKVAIIAHSMGGLVSRGFINLYEHKLKFPVFISISTPWNGQEFAKDAKEYKKYLPQAFVNMVPNSAYQKKILNENFPEELKHYLFFGYKGKSSFVLEKSNDGTISLSSQLHDEAQKQTSHIYGFNENHVSILKSKRVIEKINNILKKEL